MASKGLKVGASIELLSKTCILKHSLFLFKLMQGSSIMAKTFE